MNVEQLESGNSSITFDNLVSYSRCVIGEEIPVRAQVDPVQISDMEKFAKAGANAARSFNELFK